MDLPSARALLIACKSNAVQEVMLQLYKEEAKNFRQTCAPFFTEMSPKPLQTPQIVAARGEVEDAAVGW